MRICTVHCPGLQKIIYQRGWGYREGHLLATLDMTVLATDFLQFDFSVVLGVTLDQELTLVSHIHSLSCACYYQLSQALLLVHLLLPPLSSSCTRSLVHSIITLPSDLTIGALCMLTFWLLDWAAWITSYALQLTLLANAQIRSHLQLYGQRHTLTPFNQWEFRCT